MCEAWRVSYEAFRDWARANGYRDDLTIERKDVNGNYEPGNCAWIPKADQSLNWRCSVLATAFGETKSLGAWVRDARCRVAYATLYNRIVIRGLDAELAMTASLSPGHPIRRTSAATA
jgi:hypothetical protein